MFETGNVRFYDMTVKSMFYEFVQFLRW
jgi:hypothetical protein